MRLLTESMVPRADLEGSRAEALRLAGELHCLKKLMERMVPAVQLDAAMESIRKLTAECEKLKSVTEKKVDSGMSEAEILATNIALQNLLDYMGTVIAAADLDTSHYSMRSEGQENKRKKDLLDSILLSASGQISESGLVTKVECLKLLLEQMVPIAQLHAANFSIGRLTDEVAQLRLQMKDMMPRVDHEKSRLEGRGTEMRFPISLKDLEELRWKVAETEAQAVILSHQLDQERETNAALHNILSKVSSQYLFVTAHCI
jgi:hypothetical protein